MKYQIFPVLASNCVLVMSRFLSSVSSVGIDLLSVGILSSTDLSDASVTANCSIYLAFDNGKIDW